MVVVDYVILSIIAISALIGLARGFLREILSLAIWALAVILALGFADQMVPLLPKRIDGESLRFVAAFAVIFVGTLLAGAVVQWLVGQMVASTGLSGTDRLIGLVFGALRGAVVCIVAAIALRPFMAEQAWWQESRVMPALSAFEVDVMQAFSSGGDLVNELREKR
jgi:membrane protein required for colicin V production